MISKSIGRVAVITSQWPLHTVGGGISRPTGDLVQFLLSLGVRVRLFLSKAVEEESIRELIFPAGLEVERFTLSEYGMWQGDVSKERIGISEQILAWSPTLVISQDWRGLASKFAALGTRPPLITWAHGGTNYLTLGRGRKIMRPLEFFESELEKQQIERSDLIISPSEFLLKLYSRDFGYSLPDSKVLPYWFPTLERLIGPERSSSTVNLVFVGQLSRRKGLPRFLRIVKSASRRFPGLTVEIAGASSDFSGHRVCNRLLSAGISARYLGVMKAEELWTSFSLKRSILIVTSELDNSPNTVYEAASAGISVLIVGEKNGAAELASCIEGVHWVRSENEIDWTTFGPTAERAGFETHLGRQNQETSERWEEVIASVVRKKATRPDDSISEPYSLALRIGMFLEGVYCSTRKKIVKSLRSTIKFL